MNAQQAPTIMEITQEDVRKSFGERLKTLRNGLKTEQLAAVFFDKEGSTWNNWEKGDAEPFPAFETLCKIARFFHVSADWLLGLTDDPTPSKEIQPHATQPKD